MVSIVARIALERVTDAFCVPVRAILWAPVQRFVVLFCLFFGYDFGRLAGLVARVVMALSFRLFGGLLLVWVLVIGHGVCSSDTEPTVSNLTRSFAPTEATSLRLVVQPNHEAVAAPKLNVVAIN